MQWFDRMNEARTQKGWSHAELARRAGISPENMRKYATGSVAKPRGDIVDKIASALGVDPLWLERGISGDQGLVPIVGKVLAGTDNAISFIEMQGVLDYAPRPPDSKATTVAVRVTGTSMQPRAEDGDLIYYDDRYDTVDPRWFGKLCVVWTDDERVVIKRPVPGTKPGHFHLLSDNAPPLYDLTIRFAARVSWIRPSD